MNRKLSGFLVIAIILLFPAIAKSQVTANFSANIISGCSPLIVQFTDLSTGNPTSWQWDLGNSATSTLQNPSTTYVAAGTYTISLTVSNAGGTNTKTVVGYINVIPSPIIDFTGDTTSTCVPKTIQFTSNVTAGTPGSTSYSWDFGDGFTANTPNPLHVYQVAGNYSVTLIVTNSSNCNKSLVKNNYIHAIAKPVASFTVTNGTACNAPLTATFNNTSTGGVSYAWAFGDGGTSTAASPTHSYATNGSYTVRLIVNSIGGCSDTLIMPNAVVISNPVAGFTPTNANACIGVPITFTNTTVPSTVSSAWSFGDGGTATTLNGTHTYATAGTFPVKLVVSLGTCKDSVTQNVIVRPKPVGQFSATPNQSCVVPFTANFVNTTTGGNTYSWNFGNGGTSTATNPSYTYSSAGLFPVTLISTSIYGCVDSITYPNYIQISTPQATIVPTGAGGCVPYACTFYGSVVSAFPVANYNWDFGDGFFGTGTGASHTYTTPGNYNVVMTGTTTNGCSFSASYTMVVTVKPIAAFTATPTNACTNVPITFTSTSITSPGSTYTWHYGNGASSSTTTSPTNVTSYNAPGTFSPFLVVSNGFCVDTLQINNYINIAGPTAKFIPQMNCANRLLVNFVNTSTGATYFHWDFGDGATSLAVNPTHTYASYGVYTVTLIDSAGPCMNMKAMDIHLFPIPTSFSSPDTNICKGTTATFTPPPTIHNLTYTWFFGDGASTVSSTASPVTHTYNVAGTYNVKLIVSDTNNCRDSLVKMNYVKVSEVVPILTANPHSGCSPLNVAFTDSTLGVAGATITGRAWYFGDGNFNIGNSSPIAHTYISPVPITYNVKLVVTNSYGCKDSVTLPLISITKPVVGYTSDTTLCKGQTVQFNNTTVAVAPATYQWNFGDGGNSNLASPTHIYNTTGTFPVRLIVTDGGGCADTVIRNHVVQQVTASFTMSDTAADCPPLLVIFTNTSPGINTYLWTFGNNNTSTLGNPSTVYTTPGIYHPKLIVTDNFGCTDTVSKTVTLTGPSGTFTYAPLSGCVPLTVTFNSVAVYTQFYYWDMNNGTTIMSTTGSASYTYTQPGNYVPVLILTSGANCTKVVQGLDTIKIEELSGAFTYPSPICQNTTIQFTDTAWDSQPAIITREWNFGDGGTSTLHNPSHTYVNPGTFTVRLILHNNHGCHDTTIHTVMVHATPNVTVASNQSICIGSSAQLLASGANTYLWGSPSTGLSCTGCDNPTASPTVTTTYIVYGTDTASCSDTGMVTITVNPIPNVTATGGIAICAGGSAPLQANGATSYSWTPLAAGLSCTNCANPTATPSATTTYVVTGTSLGCSDTGIVTVTVNTTPTLTITPNTSICAGGSAQLNVSGQPGLTFVWSPATGLSCTTCDNPIATPTVTTTYTVTGSTGVCSNTAQVTVSVVTLPAVSAGPNQSICNGTSTNLNATGATTYVWNPDPTLSCTNCQNPVATPTVTTTYTVTGSISGSTSCSNTSQVTITVNPLPATDAGIDPSICLGTSTPLTATGANTYVWTPNPANLSCYTCANPTANPPATTTYVVTGTTTATGCTKKDTITVNVLPLPTISAGNAQTICLATPAQLQATGGVSYVWGTPNTTLSCTTCSNPIATPTTTTTYNVTGTGANGCTNTSSVIVSMHPQPVINAGTTQNICLGNSIQLQATGASTYVWTPATGLSCTTCPNPIASPTVTTIYKAVGTSVNGCRDSAIVTVNVFPIPVVNAGADQSICLGAPANLQATGAVSYVWSPATGLSCTNCANPTATPAITTTYTVTGTTGANCSSTDQVTVTVMPLPVISAGPAKTICQTSSVQLQATGGVSYTWSPAAGLSCANCPNPIATPSAPTTYTITGTGANGCTNTSTIQVNFYPQPVIDAGPDKTICRGQFTTLQATGASTYLWTPPTALSCVNCANPVASPLNDITYYVVGTDANGCNDSDKVTVTVIQKSPTTVGPEMTICKGEKTQLLATGGLSYSWSPASSLSNSQIADPVAAPDVTTKYTVIIKQNACFDDTLTQTVVVRPVPTVSLGADKVIFAGETVNLYANTTNATTYAWAPGEGLSCVDCISPTATPTRSTTYTITVSNEFGCKATDDIRITLKCDGSMIFVPNMFTPNGDMQNDRFYPNARGITNVDRFRVYDRWGELIFDSLNMPMNDPAAGWDGTFRNQVLKPDVFVWILDATCINGDHVQTKGDVSLVR